MEQVAMYPDFPGYKEQSTSKQAAVEAASRAGTLRFQCLAALELYPMSADQIAYHLDENILSIRPRISELRKMGLIEKTGKRRINDSGKQAIVWRKL